jgi:hypothetical protein
MKLPWAGDKAPIVGKFFLLATTAQALVARHYSPTAAQLLPVFEADRVFGTLREGVDANAIAAYFDAGAVDILLVIKV